MTNDDPLANGDARALAQALQSRTLSCRELMSATLARVESLNPRLNAIVSLADPAELLRQAGERDAELARGAPRGWLHGLPIAVKDTAMVTGFPTTQGSPIFRHAVATQDSLHVARMKAAGAIVIGKSNVPEFALGGHTYNTVFGSTGNAWDASVSAGGSSGGAAVALAHRLLAVADGSDFMGSLRNPAGWNHVFGLRPSAGRVPGWPRPDVWVAQLSSDGPMARTVRDLAALLDVLAGHEPARALVAGQRHAELRARPRCHAARPAHRLAGRPGWPPRDGTRHPGRVRSSARHLRGRRRERRADAARLFSRSAVGRLDGVAPRADLDQRRRGPAHARRAPRRRETRSAVGTGPGAGPGLRRLHAGEPGTHDVPAAPAGPLRTFRPAGAAGGAGLGLST